MIDNTTNPSVSVVTPTFNRADLLSRCLEHLMTQTDKDFEWIIVDDGSTDGTDEKVKSFEADFPITYVKKTNGGKHTALNESHEYISGRFVVILDSDDYLIDSAVADIKDAWDRYESMPEIGIVLLLKGRAVDDPSCKGEVENVPIDIMRNKRIHYHSNDCCEVIRAEAFKEFPFPEFEGEKFLSEGALWNRVSFRYKGVYVNKVVYIADYLEGGLTKSGKPLRVHNPNGGMYTANLNMSSKNYLKRRIKNGLLYNCYGFFAEKSFMQASRECQSKGMMMITRAPGWLLYKMWKKKYY